MKQSSCTVATLAALAILVPVTPTLAKSYIDIGRDAATDEERGHELQDAVRNLAHAGHVLRLASGRYVLDPAKPDFGRLILQPGMDIVGANQYVDCDGDGVHDPFPCGTDPSEDASYTVDGTETVIDGSNVPNPPRQQGPGLIRLGTDNTLSNVTVKGNAAADGLGANVHINLHVGGIVNASVVDVLSDGGFAGIRCNNPQGLLANTIAEARLEGNIVRNAATWGIVINNANTEGNVWQVGLSRNRIYANTAGILVLNNQSSHVETSVASKGNLIESNKAGVLVMGGQDAGGQVGRGGSDNQAYFVSQRDVIRNNVGAVEIQGMSKLGGGVIVMAGGNVTPDLSSSNGNEVVVQLVGTTLSGNRYSDATKTFSSHVSAFGYWTYVDRVAGTVPGVPGPGPGVDNVARVHVRLSGNDQPTEGFWMRATVGPNADLTSTNTVDVSGSNAAFQTAGQDGLAAGE